ncbi:recombination protein RecT [Brevibacillus formosus]|uniref:recombination protein RecT n=1 Tax=Brevibacillus formosus TaxID=54913 RepID=UPI001CA5A2BC|nr:recombination protein RecT [Brevibacillus formosus]MBW5468486.1 recombination protein RecT [Brevibacillus formosus]
MGNPQEMAGKLAERASNNSPEKKETTIFDLIESRKDQFAQAAGNNMDVNKFLRIATFSIRTNPKLMNCSAPSLLSALMQSAQLGLEPGVLGHCYLVPFWSEKLKSFEATFIISYKGMIELARRSGNIQSIAARIVYENDEFQFEYGLEERLIHKPCILGERGQMKLVYMVAHFVGGGHYIEVMTKTEIDAVMISSKSYDKKKKQPTGPWKDHYEEMAKKTVIRRAWKYLPISVDDARVVEQEGTVKHDIADDMSTVAWIDAEAYAIEDESELSGDPQQQTENTEHEEDLFSQG